MILSVSQARGTGAVAIAARVFLTILLALAIRPASAQTAQAKFVISAGAPANKVASGTLWLYSYSWYGLQRYQLGVIQNGLVVLPLDTDRVKREANPHPDTSAYVVVIQAGEHVWFRTPDIDPDRFWIDLPGAVRRLGRGTELPTGETQLVLPAPVRRHVTLLYPDGRAKANFDLDVSMYLWDENHCGVHEGLPLGHFRTDARGTIEVPAPLVPLYLDGLEYYASVGTGPAGPAYSRNTGMKIPADEAVEVKVAWTVPEFPVQLRVLTPGGQPHAGVDVYANWNTNTCGGHDRVAQTDGTGTVRLNLDATFTGLTLMLGGPYSAGDSQGIKNTRALTGAELRKLFSEHELTVRW